MALFPNIWRACILEEMSSATYRSTLFDEKWFKISGNIKFFRKFLNVTSQQEDSGKDGKFKFYFTPWLARNSTFKFSRQAERLRDFAPAACDTDAILASSSDWTLQWS